DAAALRDRHAAFFAALAGNAEPGLRGPLQGSWLARVDADRENIRAALAHDEETGRLEQGMRAAAALWRYWQFRGEHAEGRARLERMLAANASVSVRARAEALGAAGRLAMMHGD